MYTSWRRSQLIFPLVLSNKQRYLSVSWHCLYICDAHICIYSIYATAQMKLSNGTLINVTSVSWHWLLVLCIYERTYMHTFVRISITIDHIYPRTRAFTYIYACIYACIYVYIYIYIYVYINVCVRVCFLIHTHIGGACSPTVTATATGTSATATLVEMKIRYTQIKMYKYRYA